MNKYKVIFLLAITFAILTSGCGRTMSMDDLVNEANFEAFVEEAYEKSILVKVSTDEYSMNVSSIKVSLDVKIKDGATEFEIGDKVKVYYDGNIKEGHPAQIDNTYAIIIMDRRNN